MLQLAGCMNPGSMHFHKSHAACLDRYLIRLQARRFSNGPITLIACLKLKLVKRCQPGSVQIPNRRIRCTPSSSCRSDETCCWPERRSRSIRTVMKKVLRFFSGSDEDSTDTIGIYKEPILNARPGANPRDIQATGRQRDPLDASDWLPTDYAGIVAYFQKKVSDRRSPYNALVNAADRLSEFIPDDTSRLKAVLAVCGEQWPLDALSLAISAHISDIELARTKAKSNTHRFAKDRAAHLRNQADELKERNAKIMDEIRSLKDSLVKLEGTLNDNMSTLASLNEQIQLADAGANSMAFVDQAAENLKNDLLAKKVLLGLP
jgi:hypothetical protein